MDGGRFHKISCIFDAIDLMATTNADFERSRAVIEKGDLVLHLNVLWLGVKADRKIANDEWNQRWCMEGVLTRSATYTDFERSRAVIEEHDLVLYLNVIWRRVRAGPKFLMVNGGKEDS